MTSVHYWSIGLVVGNFMKVVKDNGRALGDFVPCSYANGNDVVFLGCIVIGIYKTFDKVAVVIRWQQL